MESVSRSLSYLLSRWGLSSCIAEHQALFVWDEVVGENVMRVAWPLSVRGGVLLIQTKSSVWAQELSMRRGEIIRKLNERIGKQVICEIRFTSARQRKSGPEEETLAKRPKERELITMQLASDQQDGLGRVAGQVRDANVRASLLRFLETSAKAQAWRHSQGWQPCVLCGEPVAPDQTICSRCHSPGTGKTDAELTTTPDKRNS